VADPTRSTLQHNLQQVRQRIREAAARAGRPPESVTLVGVTKLVSAEAAKQLHELGVADLGENRLQELERKRPLLPAGVRWHLIGPIQANKARKAVASGALLHAVDSEELLSRLDRIAAELATRVRCLLEVNISGEATKHGFAPARVAEVLESQRSLERVDIAGLMTMAPLQASTGEQHQLFRELRELRDAGDRNQRFRGAPSGHGQLSMGMTNDFEAAVEEGATLVRVGTALFTTLQASESRS
jgi:pyridoxal phosphate enzyme (YggS family)